MNTRLATGIQLSRRLRSELSNAASISTGATNKASARSGSSEIRGLLGRRATITPPSANRDGDGTLIRRASAASNTAPTSSDNVQSRILMRGPQPEGNPASELLRSAGQRNPGRGGRALLLGTPWLADGAAHFRHGDFDRPGRFAELRGRIGEDFGFNHRDGRDTHRPRGPSQRIRKELAFASMRAHVRIVN